MVALARDGETREVADRVGSRVRSRRAVEFKSWKLKGGEAVCVCVCVRVCVHVGKGGTIYYALC